MGKDQIKILSKALVEEMSRKDPGFRESQTRILFARELGIQVSLVRKRRRISEEQLGAKIGRDAKAVRAIEKGEYKRLTVDLLFKIVDALETRISVQFTES